MHRIGFLLTFTLLAGVSIGQIDVTNDLTIEEYVTDILLGSGVQASNITFTGWENQIGLLNGGDGTIFPMDAGLVLSSANAQNLDGSFDENVPFGSGVSGETDLLNIANSVPPLIGQNFTVNSVNDVCILEFDFIATGDTVKFNYSFGSDEYLGWVNSQYNDIFAFLLSGDGIAGPYDSPAAFPGGAVNIAQVPDTDPPLPITISSVNNVTNSEYYIDNPSNTDIMINGFTTKLQAVYEVECGGSYHMKLAIADGSDTILESIVVLEQGSFESNAVVQVSLETDVGVFYDEAIIYEDCGEAVLTIERPIETILDVEETVLMSYGGTAENGIDFTELPTEAVFPPFVQVLEYPMDAFLDGLPEGQEEVTIEFLNLAACGGSGLTSYFTFIVDDSPDPLVVDGYDIDICLGDEITLTPVISGGYGNFDFDWTPLTDISYEIDVAPIVNTTYFLTVSDTCGVIPVSTEFDVNVSDFPDLTVDIAPDDIVLGCFDGMNLTATAAGGDGNYVEYSWYNDNDENLWGWMNTLWVSPWNGSQGVNVTVTDGCGFTATDAVNVTFSFPELVVEQEPLEVVCGTNFTIEPDVSGGEGFYNYNWYVNGLWVDWQATYTTSTEDDMVITVEVFDDCGQTTSLDIPITVSSPDIELTLEDEVIGSCIDVFDIEPIVGAGSGDFNFSWILNGVEIGNEETLSFQSDIDVVIQLLIEDGCGAQVFDQIQVTIENPPVDLDLGADIDASCIDNTEIDALINTGSGGYVYSWQIDGQEVGTGSSLSWQTYETEQVTLEVTDGCGGYDMDQVQINIPDIPLVMTTSQDTSICMGGTAFIGALAEGGEGGFVYYWTGVNTYGQDVIVTPQNTQYFNVTATDICGESITDQVQVNVQNMFADFTVTYITESEVQFNATIDPPCPDCDLIWDFGDGDTSDEQSPLHVFDGLGAYTVNLTLVTDIGCVDDSHTLIHSPALLYIPNAFTPNNDGVNDVWQVIGDEILHYEMVVFNRWGETVFYSNDHTQPWIGDLDGGTHYVPNGTYSYVVKVKSYNSDAFEKTGTVTLMR